MDEDIPFVAHKNNIQEGIRIQRRELFVGHHKNWKTTTNQLCSELDVPQDHCAWCAFG